MRRMALAASLVLAVGAGFVGGFLARGRPAAVAPGRSQSPATLIVVVPSVVGLTTAAATTALRALGLAVRLQAVASKTVQMGVIVSQTPSAGTRVDRGTTVAITSSRGPPVRIAGG